MKARLLHESINVSIVLGNIRGYHASLRDLKPHGAPKVWSVIQRIWCEPMEDIVNESTNITWVIPLTDLVHNAHSLTVQRGQNAHYVLSL